MATLQEVRQRKKSIQATQKLTSAMKMVAAAKLRKAQTRFHQAQTRLSFLEETTQSIASQVDPSDWPFFVRPHTVRAAQNPTTLLIVIGADKGLCGGFNGNVIRRLIHEKATADLQGTPLRLMGIGQKITRALAPSAVRPLVLPDHVLYTSPLGNQPDFATAHQVTHRVLALLEKGIIHKCDILCTQFRSVISQAPRIVSLFDFSAPRLPSLRPPLMEPDPIALLDHALRLFIPMRLLTLMLESLVSEQGARMTAMENATRNSEKILKELELTYNQTRQALITRELIEVISGANAV